MHASHDRQGVSGVIEFTSHAGAKLMATEMLRSAIRVQKKGSRISHFTVKGVPGVSGATARGRTASTTNAYWVAGQCMFGAADYVPKNAGPVSGPVIAGIKSLARRVHGSCP